MKISILRLQAILFFYFVMLVFSTFIAGNTQANSIFYQPLERDSTITDKQWNTLFAQTRQLGYTELVVQWTKFGNVKFVEKNSFLRGVIKKAQEHNFKIWMGLYLPENYYQVMQNPVEIHHQYFKKVLSENKNLISQLEVRNLVAKDKFIGWYLPIEITHEYLAQQSSTDRQTTLTSLREFKNSIVDQVAISYFLSEKTPLIQASFDVTILEAMGFDLWLQKGNGLNKQTVAEQLIKRLGCSIGVITENFVQVSETDASFKAIKKAPISDEIIVKGCQKQLTFSLRYLSFSPLMLE